MTLRIPAKVLLHVWSYDFYDMTLSTGKQRRHMIKARCVRIILVVVTLVAYRHDVWRENLKFWLFQNYVKSDLMSNNMKMNGDIRN